MAKNSSKQCTVVIHGRRCPNKRAPNKRSCGHHTSSRSTSTRRAKKSFIHFDASIPTLPEAPRWRQVDFPYPEVKHDPFRFTGLPTNPFELADFVAQWIARGHTFHDVEQLAPHVLSTWPDDFGLAAMALLAVDNPPPAGYRMKFASTAICAVAVPA